MVAVEAQLAVGESNVRSCDEIENRLNEYVLDAHWFREPTFVLIHIDLHLLLLNVLSGLLHSLVPDP